MRALCARALRVYFYDEESWGSLDKFNEKDLYLNCLTEWKSNRWDEYYVDGACGFDS